MPPSALYLAHFAAMGLMGTFWPLHLVAIGLSKFQIGLLFSGRTIVSLLTQPLWAHRADVTGATTRVLRYCALAALVISLAIPIVRTFALFALAFWGLNLFQSATIPLLDAHVIESHGSNYGRVRVWGSVGYGLSVALFGAAFASASSAETGAAALIGFVVALAAVWGASLKLPGADAAPQRRELLWRPPRTLLLFLLANVLHWSTISAYNIFLSLHIEELGGSSMVTGVAVGVSISGEALAFVVMRRWIGAGREVFWMRIAWLATALRWGLMVWLTHPAWIVSVQVLHFFSFGVWYFAALGRLGEWAELRGRASVQGIFSAVALAGGSLLGLMGGGWCMDAGGGPLLFGVAALVELLALAMLILLVRERGYIRSAGSGSERHQTPASKDAEVSAR